MINRPIIVIKPPNKIYVFIIWPGKIKYAINEAINGSPRGIDATTVGEKYLTK
tara:strand:+ start:357 stop:515 length:159 start_codon:yes stop_codon:yes gene_type:complete